MPAGVTELINGMLGGGIVAVVATVIGFLFREKWKQMLQRSLVQDMEQIKHDFERKLEAYKVTLIAEAEAAKAKQELRKSIALRYAEIEFERLVELEQILSPLTFKVMSYAQLDVSRKTNEQLRLVLEEFDKLNRVVDRAEIFITLEDERRILEHRKLLQGLVNIHVGANQPVATDSNPAIDNLIKSNIAVNNIVRGRIKELGKL